MGAERGSLFDCVVGPAFVRRPERAVWRDFLDASGKHRMDSTARSISSSGQRKRWELGCSTFMIFDTDASKNRGNSLKEIKCSWSLVTNQSPYLLMFVTSTLGKPLPWVMDVI